MARNRRASSGSSSPSSSIHRPQTRGPGIGLKFALPVCAVMVLIVGGLGWTVYSEMKRALEESIDNAGAFAATSMAAPDWHNPDNQKRLKEQLQGSVREVAIFEKSASGGPSLIATATGTDELKIAERDGERFEGSTVIRRGRMTLKNGDAFNYRSFSRPISRPGSTVSAIGTVEVYLSEEAIEDELSALLNRIIIFSALGILLGVVTCVVTARVITRPIHALVGDIRTVAQGRLDHRTRARSRDEIGTLATAFDEMTRGLEEGAQLKEDLVSKEHQEQIIQEIQERLFPRALPELSGAVIDAACQPAGEISSDLFDFISVDDHRTGLLLLTASGQGIPAAFVLAMARSALRSVAPGVESPAEVLKRINALISPDLRRGMYVTAMYAVFDARSGQTAVASAGHKLPALHFHADAEKSSRSHPPGIAMGLDKGPVFDASIEEASLTLKPGDALLLGTNGVLSLVLKNGEELGEARFYKAAQAVMASGETSIAEALCARVDSNLAEDPGDHDITLVSLRRQP